MSERRISAEEFIKRCDKAGEMFIGRFEGLEKCKKLIAKLQFDGFTVELLDNSHQESYSPNLWVKPSWRSSKGIKRLSLDASALKTLMCLCPDEFDIESDGAFRMWWD